MALIKCRECAQIVSSEAHSCPHCGAPQAPVPPIIPVQNAQHAPSKREKKGGLFSGCLAIVMIFVIVCILGGVVSSEFGSTGNSSSPRPKTITPKAMQVDHERRAAQVAIPKDVKYIVIDENTMPGIKRGLTVRLSRKVSQDVLKSIANRLRDSDPNTFDRTFIDYYLPGMEVGAGAWATTHFNPQLEVRILGLSVEQEKALRELPEDHSRQTIGNWFGETPGLAGRISIFRKNGKVFMQNTYKDGSGDTNEMSESVSPLGYRFDKLEGSSAGDCWIIDSNGDLQIRDNDGLITKALKME